uniref:Uncharacterized protein n=1 Tax=Triticum urartu TaxID=4572 RepID=A0A8R7UWP6_TRIUA
MTGTREEFDSEERICVAVVNERAQRGGRPCYSSSLRKGSSISSSSCSSSDKESLARKNKSGFDALHVTSKEGHGDIVKVLLDHDRSLGKTFGQSKCDSSDNCGD